MGKDGALMSGAVGCVGVVWIIVIFWKDDVFECGAFQDKSGYSPSRAAASWRRENAAGLTGGMVSPVELWTLVKSAVVNPREGDGANRPVSPEIK